MDAGGRDGIHMMETERMTGCAFAVLNALGHGFHEIPFAQQARYPITDHESKVGEYVPDLVVIGKMVVDTQTIDRITDHEVGRMLNYLRATGLHVGLILNFKYAKLQFRRVTLTPPSHPLLNS